MNLKQRARFVMPAFLAACLLAAAPARGAEPAPPFQCKGVAIPGVNAGSDVVSVNLNQDDRPDLAVIAGSSLRISLQNPDGTFTSGDAYPFNGPGGLGSVSKGLLAADLDGDGRTDLAFMENEDVLRLCYGNGAGGFPEQHEIDLAATLGLPNVGDSFYAANLIARGDFNEDARPDLAVACDVGGPAILLTAVSGFRGEANFASISGLPVGGSNSIAVGDFNGDGHQDLVTADCSLDNYTLYIGHGDGTFDGGVKTYVPKPLWLGGADAYDSHVVCVGDVDGDDDDDLVITVLRKQAPLYVCLGTGQGILSRDIYGQLGGDPADSFNELFAAPVFFTGTALFGREIQGRKLAGLADFNGDGARDLAIGCGGADGGVFLLPGTGTGSFKGVAAGGAEVRGGNCGGLALGDVDADGRGDLAHTDAGTALGIVSLNRLWRDAPQIWMEPDPTLEHLPYTEVTFVIVDAQGWGNVDFDTLVVDVNGGQHLGPWVRDNAAWSVSAGGRIIKGRVLGTIPPNAHRFDLSVSDLSVPPHTGSGSFVYD